MNRDTIFKKYDTGGKEIFKNLTFMQDEFPDQKPENDEGNTEYKWKLVFEDDKERSTKLRKLSSQMIFRLYEGNGKALYLLGITDDGDALGMNVQDLYLTLVMIDEAATRIDCEIKNVRIYRKERYYIVTIRLYKKECEFTI